MKDKLPDLVEHRFRLEYLSPLWRPSKTVLIENLQGGETVRLVQEPVKMTMDEVLVASLDQGKIDWTAITKAFSDAVAKHAPKKVAPKNPPCLYCSKELSGYLDAYHGKDPNGSKICAPCRQKRKIR